jgi:hypothetical protein
MPLRRPFSSGIVASSAEIPPNWYTAINTGEWGVLSTSTLTASGVGWSGTAPGGAGNYTRVLTAWGGAIINTDGVYNGATWIPGEFMILWGGGHTDYSGNEVYAFGPLFSDSAAWYRLRDPTIPAVNNLAYDGSGLPSSRHTYDQVVYVSDGTRKWMLTAGAAAMATGGGNAAGTSAFDFSVSAPNTNNPWLTKADQSYNGGYTAVLDPATNVVWSSPSSVTSVVQTYDVTANTASAAFSKTHTFTDAMSPSSALDTTRGIWATYSYNSAGPTTNLEAFRITSTSNDWYSISLTGASLPNATGTIIYDAINDRFVVWAGGGKTFYTITPPGTSPYQGGNAWTVASVTPGSGSTPSAAQTNGTYGRFRYLVHGNWRGYVLLNSDTGSVYYYKL